MADWFNQLKIQSKLFGIFGFIILIGTLTVGAGIFNVISMKSEANDLFKQEQELDDAYRTQTFLEKLDLAEKDYLLSGDSRYLDNHGKYNAQIDVFLRNALLKADTTPEKAALYDLERAKQAYEQSFAEIMTAYDKGDRDEAFDLSLYVSSEAIDNMWEQVDSIVEEGETFLEEKAGQIDRHAKMSNIVGVFVLVFFLALAIAAAVVITNQVNRPVLLLTDATAAVEEGRFEPGLLRGLVNREDEIGQLARAFVHMAEEVRNRQANLRQQADEIRLKIEQQTRKN